MLHCGSVMVSPSDYGCFIFLCAQNTQVLLTVLQSSMFSATEVEAKPSGRLAKDKQRQTAKDSRSKCPLVSVLGFCFAFVLVICVFCSRIPIPRSDSELLDSSRG